MKLHYDKKAFDAIIQKIAQRTQINPSIIEKDYYVTLVLQEIASRQDAVPAFFKGGTCLYKVYLDMKRFSEDIDLTVQIDNLSNSQAKKRLEKAARNYEYLERLKGDPLEENHKGSITTIFGYEPLYNIDVNDQLQRYGKLKIEATSFTISEPIETNKISSLIFQYATGEERKLLMDNYEVSEFEIQNISIERMFADKLLAAEFYLERGLYFDVSKHIYDLSEMIHLPRVASMLSDENKFIKALSYKREEEKSRIGSDLSKKPLKNLLLFSGICNKNSKFRTSFSDMQRIYVIHDNDKKEFDDIIRELDYIKNLCYKISNKEQEFTSRKEDIEFNKELCKSSNIDPLDDSGTI